MKLKWATVWSILKHMEREKPQKVKRGVFLVATPQLTDPDFRQTVVQVCEHGSGGSLGLVVNRRTDIPTAKHPRARRLGYAANAVPAMNLDFDGELLAALAASDAAVAEMARQDDASLKALAAYEATQPIADAEAQIDRAEELNKVWKVKRGDLFRVGNHRLLCGDSTVRADVERVMDGEKCGTLTDPPYGVNFAYDTASQDAVSENDRITNAVIPNCPHPLVYTPGKRHLLRELQRWEEKQVKLIAWNKKFSMTRSGLGGSDVWEIVLAVEIDSKTASLPTNHIEIMTDREPGLLEKHPCPKPVSLFQHLAKCLMPEFVLDPFCGSGTTLVACENLGRRGRAIEISPAYCAVSLQRMQDAFPSLEIERL